MMRGFVLGALLGALVLLGVLAAGGLWSPVAPAASGGLLGVQGVPDASRVPELSLQGLLRVNVSVSSSTIVLTSGCRQASMVTLQSQVDSISSGLDRVIQGRPNAHDVLKEVVEGYGIQVLFVKVERFDREQGAYYARILLLQGSRILSLDSKPSDAIALAVRLGAPVYMTQAMMDQLGEKIC
ncbi:MAG: bifunctional nuclease family protein [Euryarchaeota archaeon]|nr:bifunctional nuclease family protein [Euryarchaeota archaeon]